MGRQPGRKVGLAIAKRAVGMGAVLDRPGVLKWDVAGNCNAPVSIDRTYRDRVTTLNNHHVAMEMEVRCRKCPACLAARRRLWSYRGKQEVALAPRTWWCTYTVPAHIHYQVFCHIKGAEKLSEDALFRERCRIIGNWFTKYVRRVRKRLHALEDGTVVDWEDTSLRYLLVFERHQGGGANHLMPHMHALIHEVPGRPVLVKRRVQYHWPWFSNVSLVGDDADERSKKVHYVTKYIAKEACVRIRASPLYGRMAEYTLLEHSESAQPKPQWGLGGNVLASAVEREGVTYLRNNSTGNMPGVGVSRASVKE